MQQPTHTLEYMNFSGVIEDGYGKGRVSIARREAVEILHVDDRHVRFNLYPGQKVEEYLLIRTQGSKWLLRDITSRRQERDAPEKLAAAQTMGEVFAAFEDRCAEGTSRPRTRGDLTRRLAAIMAKMQPGDIVNTDPRLREGFGGRVYKPLSEFVQGTGYGHSAIYEGRGMVIEARSGFGVQRRRLADMAQCNKFVVIRPRASREQRQRALAYVRKQIGRPFSDPRLTVSGAKPTFLSDRHQRQRQALTSVFCSNLIANAYDQVPFNPERTIDDTRPVDILKSKLVKRIGKLG